MLDQAGDLTILSRHAYTLSVHLGHGRPIAAPLGTALHNVADTGMLVVENSLMSAIGVHADGSDTPTGEVFFVNRRRKLCWIRSVLPRMHRRV